MLRKHLLAISAETTEESKETVTVGTSTAKLNGTYLTATHSTGHLKSHPVRLTYDQGFRETKEQEAFEEPCPPPHLRSRGSVFSAVGFGGRVAVVSQLALSGADGFVPALFYRHGF